MLLNYGTICQYFKYCVFVGMFCMIKVASCRSQSPLHGTVTLPLTMLRNGFLDLVVQRNMGCFLGFILKGSERGNSEHGMAIQIQCRITDPMFLI